MNERGRKLLRRPMMATGLTLMGLAMLIVIVLFLDDTNQSDGVFELSLVIAVVTGLLGLVIVAYDANA